MKKHSNRLNVYCTRNSTARQTLFFRQDSGVLCCKPTAPKEETHRRVSPTLMLS